MSVENVCAAFTNEVFKAVELGIAAAKMTKEQERIFIEIFREHIAGIAFKIALQLDDKDEKKPN